jgi:CDP-glucose 4,6-dehydratase
MEYPLGQRLRELPGPLLLTGHTGFKGTWMTFLLERLNVPVVGYSLPAEKDSLYDRAARTGAIPEALTDIRDYAALEKFIDLHKPSTIIHMAAQPLVLKSYESPRETFDVNVMGTVNVLDIAFKRDFIKAIIVVTTDKVYRNDNSGRAFVEADPLEGKDPYSASKVGTEAVVAAWQQIANVSGGPRVVSVRAGNVIGGGDFAKDRVIPDLIRGVMSGKSVEIRNPQSTRPWQHVLDPLSGYLLTLERVLDNETSGNFNFSPQEKSLSVIEVVQIAISCWGAIEIKSPVKKVRDVNDNQLESRELRLDSKLATNLLGWKPRFSQVEAVTTTIEWWKSYYLEKEEPSTLIEKDIENFFRSQVRQFNIRSRESVRKLTMYLATVNDKATQVYSYRNLKETILIATLWFVIALNRALPDGISTKIPILNIKNTSSVEEVRRAWGQGDAGSLLDIAITWANLNALDPVTQYWIPRLWAPGLSILEVPLIWISRIGVPIYWSLLIFTLAIWTILFSLLWRYFSQFTGRIPMFTVSVGLLWSWDFSYLLKDYIFYTEGIGFGLLLIGLTLLTIRVVSPNEHGILYVYLSGTLIGFSIWIRHSNESGLILLFLLTFFGYFISKRPTEQKSIKEKKTRESKARIRLIKSEKIFLKDFYRVGLLSSGIALIVTLPWRLIATYHFQGAPFLMSSASGLVPGAIWSLPNSPGGQYWGSYGINWACKIDLETCNQVQSGISDGTMSKNHLLFLAFKSILENPLSYIEERSYFLWTNWIPMFSMNLNFQNLIAFTIMLLFFYCIYLIFTTKSKRKYPLIILWGAFLLMNLAQLAIIHYESRYFIPVRMFILGLLVSLLALKGGLRQGIHRN